MLNNFYQYEHNQCRKVIQASCFALFNAPTFEAYLIHWQLCIRQHNKLIWVTHSNQKPQFFVGKTQFVLHTKHMQRKINGSTLFAINNMYYVNFRIKNKRAYLSVVKFKTKDQKYLGTLLIFTPIPLMSMKCGLLISLYICVQGRIRECLTLTYTPFS